MFLNNFLLGLKIFFYVLREKADIFEIQIFPYFPIIFANLALFFKKDKSRIVGHWVECLGVDGWKRYDKFFWVGGYLLEKLAKSSCDSHVAISEFTRKRMMTSLKMDEKDITVIHPCGVDLEKISASANPSVGLYDIVYFGRLMSHKHVEKIILIVKKIKKENSGIRALIIGNGPDEVSLKELVRKGNLEKNVDFLDFMNDYSDLIHKIKSGKIMIFPSEREGFGISVIEANACGLPVLLLDYPDNAAKELVRNDQNGYLCKDFRELLEKSKYLINPINKEKLQKMSEYSRLYAKNYDKKEIIKKVNAFYFGK